MRYSFYTPQGNLDRQKVEQIGISLLMVVIGAISTWALEYKTGTAFGTWTPAVVVVCTLLSRIAQQWMADHPIPQNLGQTPVVQNAYTTPRPTQVSPTDVKS